MHGKAQAPDAIVKGVLIAVAAIAIAFFLFQAMSQKPAQITPTPFVATATPSPIPAPAFVEVSGLEVAQSAVKFLNEMRKSDGTYFFEKTCTRTGCVTEDKAGFPQSNAWAALAHIGLYRATKDKAHLDAAVREVEKEIEICNASTDVDKNCKWALVQAFEVYADSKDEKTREFIVSEGQKLLFAVGPEPAGNAMGQGIAARESAMLYGLTNDSRYLQRAKLFLDAGKQALNFDNRAVFYDSFSGFAVRTDECWIKIAELDLYRAGGGQQYLDSAKGFFDKAKLGDLGNGRAKNFEVVTQFHPCIESLKILAQEAGRQAYREEADALIGYLLISTFDFIDAAKHNGDGALITVPCSVSEAVCDGENKKTVTDVSYGVFLLSGAAQSSFKIPAQKASFGVVERGVVSLGLVTPVPLAKVNLTHFDELGALKVFKSSNEANTFYASYFVDINEPLESLVVSVNGEQFDFASAPLCTSASPMPKICKRVENVRSEIQYVLTYNKAQKGSSYEIVLQSKQRSASLSYAYK